MRKSLTILNIRHKEFSLAVHCNPQATSPGLGGLQTSVWRQKISLNINHNNISYFFLVFFFLIFRFFVGIFLICWRILFWIFLFVLEGLFVLHFLKVTIRFLLNTKTALTDQNQHKRFFFAQLANYSLAKFQNSTQELEEGPPLIWFFFKFWLRDQGLLHKYSLSLMFLYFC